MKAGELRERFSFDKRTVSTEPGDGYGNLLQGWTYQFSAWGGLVPLRRGESVIAARMSGNQPYILTLRRSSQSEQITTNWRCRHIASGKIYNIQTVEPSPDKASIDCMLMEVDGTADG